MSSIPFRKLYIKYSSAHKPTTLSSSQTDPLHLTTAFPTLFPMSLGGHLNDRPIKVSLVLFSRFCPRKDRISLLTLTAVPVSSWLGSATDPINLLNSYQLQEHARASIILPLLLRFFLKESWITPGYWSIISKKYKSLIYEIVRVFAQIA